jgi:Tol biopolymer transport system component
VGFLSSRGDSEETTQLWLLNRQGGEGVRVTQLTGEVEDYVWAPDGKHIVLAVTDEPEDTSKAGKAKKPKPIVIEDRIRQQALSDRCRPRR